MAMPEVVRHIMRTQNCSELEAERQLQDALASGGLRAMAVDLDTGERMPAPPEWFAKIVKQ
jgi:hypothetical protein